MRPLRRVILFLALLAVAHPVQAQIWTIACDDNFPPYNHFESDRLTGLDVLLVEALVRNAGAIPRFEAQSWNRVRERLDRDEVEAAFQFIGSPERFEKYHMVGPYRSGATVFAVRRGSAIVFENLEDLKGFRIGLVRGFRYGASFDSHEDLNKDSTAGDNGQLVRMLAAGRIELAIGDSRVLQYHLRSKNLDHEIQFLPRAYSEVSRYIAVPRSKPAVAAKLSQSLNELQQSGLLATIIAQWDLPRP